MGFTAQRVSCALARAVAWELASAMELTRVRDAREHFLPHGVVADGAVDARRDVELGGDGA